VGLFDKFKKPKAKKTMIPLEIPPEPDFFAALPSSSEIQQQPTAVSRSSAPPAPQGLAPVLPPLFENQQQPGLPPQPTTIPDFRLPPQPGLVAGQREEHEEMQYPQHEEIQYPQEQFQEIQQQSPTPQFRFYERADHPPEELPFDVSQELMTLPEVHRKAHPEQWQQPESTLKKKRHTPKQFITMTHLSELGQQLMNFREDLILAKDTAFRLTDLNEQEIEQMARWYAVQQTIEMRIAEIDKRLFKA